MSLIFRVVGHLCTNVDGFFSYYRPTTVTLSAVAGLTSETSSYRMYKSVFLLQMLAWNTR